MVINLLIMIRKYVRILEEVEAIQAKEDNLEELRAFAGEVKKVDGQKEYYNCYYIIPGLSVVLWQGSWLIKHPNGRLEIRSSQLFHNEYEPK